MKKKFALILALCLSLTIGFALAGCGSTPEPDYPDAASFEKALNAGDNLTGKTVKFEVKNIEPSSAYGYNLQAGEHLNFCSPNNPDVKAGETVTVKVKEVTSVLGSWVISYDKVG